MTNLEELQSELIDSINESSSINELEELRISALGKKGKITLLMRELSILDSEARKSAGKALNLLKVEITGCLDKKKTALLDRDLYDRLLQESLDITLPPRPEEEGLIHPISQTIEEVVTILGTMGLKVADGPNIENDWYNFTALNIPLDHPAR